MNIYFLNELSFSGRDAGFKARHDAYNILNYDERVCVIDIPLWGTLYSRIWNFFVFVKFAIFLKSSDVLIFNFPLPKPFWFVIFFFKKLIKFKLIPLIHDIDLLRGGDGDDIGRLKHCDAIISHNSRMTSFLVTSGIGKNKICNIEIFDYILKIDSVDVKKKEISDNNVRELIFAGNLSKHKSGFLYKAECKFNNLKLFGVNYTGENADSHLGSFDSANPSPLMTGNISFGLVWDGESLDTCSGDFGEYLKYNNPHKTSLYLSLGIPVIVWKNAAISDFIIENNVGFTVENIEQAVSIVNNISYDDYMNIKNNATNLARRLNEGYYLKDAITRVISCLS